MVAYDQTGGKPSMGYGSGPNGGSPVATTEQTAALLRAESTALINDSKRLCPTEPTRRNAIRFAGDFCQAAIKESVSLRNRASIFVGDGSWGASGVVLACTAGALLGAEAFPGPIFKKEAIVAGCALGELLYFLGIETDPLEGPKGVSTKPGSPRLNAKPNTKPTPVARASRSTSSLPHGRQVKPGR